MKFPDLEDRPVSINRHNTMTWIRQLGAIGGLAVIPVIAWYLIVQTDYSKLSYYQAESNSIHVTSFIFLALVAIFVLDHGLGFYGLIKHSKEIWIDALLTGNGIGLTIIIMKIIS